MIKPFGLRDVLLVRDLQRRSTILDLESALLGEYSSLRLALLAYLFHPGVGAFTCVLDSSGLKRCEKGFVQVRNKPGCPEWDVVYIAPALDEVGDALTIWYRLLTGISLIAAEEGILRVFARPVRDDMVEGVLGQAGFNVYAREMIYRIGDSSVPTWRRGERWRSASEDDREELGQLYRSVTPHLVQQAEGRHPQEGNGSLFGQLGFPGEEAYILSRDRLDAYLRLRGGPKGYWIQLLLRDSGDSDMAEVVSEGLGLLTGRPPLPVYWAVRGYQGYLPALLRGKGFEPVATRSLMVKHTTARVKVKKHKLVSTLDKGIKVTPGVAPSGGAATRLEKRV